METIIVEITAAALEESADFLLPAHVPVASLLPEIIRLVEQVHIGVAIDSEHPMLFDRERSVLLSPDETLAQAGLHFGHPLLLI